MAFSTIMTFLCIAYVLGYGGMVVYDLFFSKEGVDLTPVMVEEEIDISDEAKTFTPVYVTRAMENDPIGYPVFKGLQKPLEFMGIRGRFLTFAAGAIGFSFVGFIVFSIIMGKLAGFVAMVVIAIIGLLTIYVKQRSGLHAKKRHKGIHIYRDLYVH